MDNLNVNLRTLLPVVAYAFTQVYGEEYHDIIFKKINNAIIVPYYDIEGLSDYISYIKRCKKREYAIKFLENIGIDVNNHKKNNYTQPLDDKIEKKLECYIHSSLKGFSKDNDYLVPLNAFKTNNTTDPKVNLKNKIKIINYLLDKEHEKITEKNFDSFIKTNKFQEILKKINDLNVVYEQLLIEYRNWEKKLQDYEFFIESEQKRKAEILKIKKTSILEDLNSILPIPVINKITDKSLEEKSNAIFGDLDIGVTSIIESFSYEKIKKLKSTDVDNFEKSKIIKLQIKYLENLGIEIPKKYINLEENLNNYLSFLKQDNIKKYIPSFDVINHITSIREEKYKEAINEYYVTRKDYVDIKKIFNNNEDILKHIYKFIKRKEVCVKQAQISTGMDNESIAIMFYTTKFCFGGYLLHVFIHECGHIIDLNTNGIGFEPSLNFYVNFEKNPYDHTVRKYEKFNETLNDIFTIEVIEFLHNEGIYLIEPQEWTLPDTSNQNTALITKKLLFPLLSKFRKQIINSKINANPNELIKYIGKENFEELVDVVNKVDYLSRNGVIPKIDTSPEDEMVKEYFKQLERLEKIYISIDNYYKKNVEPLVIPADNKTTKSI